MQFYDRFPCIPKTYDNYECRDCIGPLAKVIFDSFHVPVTPSWGHGGLYLPRTHPLNRGPNFLIPVMGHGMYLPRTPIGVRVAVPSWYPYWRQGIVPFSYGRTHLESGGCAFPVQSNPYWRQGAVHSLYLSWRQGAKPSLYQSLRRGPCVPRTYLGGNGPRLPHTHLRDWGRVFLLPILETGSCVSLVSSWGWGHGPSFPRPHFGDWDRAFLVTILVTLSLPSFYPFGR